ncbi:MAG: hypothetical protein IT433_03285 [Phycisphaerales bacterium]|nr:hypothetical protein [Phycisphaerales bacterium]
MTLLLSAASNPQVAPMWLDEQAGAAPGAPWGWLIWGGAVALGLIVVALGATVRAERLRRDPGGRALRAVARRLGADRRLLKELEALAPADGGTPVLSMLVSDEALCIGLRACGKVPSARVTRLVAARGVSLPLGVPPTKAESGPKSPARPTPQARPGR